MKLAVACLNGLGVDNDPVRLEAPLRSETTDPVATEQLPSITADLREAVARLGSAAPQALIEKLKRSSVAFLEHVLDFSWRQHAKLVVVRGLELSHDCVRIAERFSVNETTVVLVGRADEATVAAIRSTVPEV